MLESEETEEGKAGYVLIGGIHPEYAATFVQSFPACGLIHVNQAI
jgi:hypothetical protein